MRDVLDTEDWKAQELIDWYEDYVKEIEQDTRNYYEAIYGLTETFGVPVEIPKPHPMLVQLWHMEAYGHLLWAGGLLDQPVWTMNLLTLCANVRTEVERVKDAQEAAKRSLEDGKK